MDMEEWEDRVSTAADYGLNPQELMVWEIDDTPEELLEIVELVPNPALVTFVPGYLIDTHSPIGSRSVCELQDGRIFVH